MTILRTGVTVAVFLLLPIYAGAQTEESARANSWVSVGGTVVSVGDTGFELDYGPGVVEVDMRNWKWDRSDHPMVPGNYVRVYGKPAENGKEKVIKAESVYLKSLNSYLFAEQKEEVFQPAIEQDRVFQLQGRIEKIDERQFTMWLGTRAIRVDTSAMPYNPLDDKGYQQLQVGDRVQVSGELTDELFAEGGGVKAQTVTSLLPGSI